MEAARARAWWCILAPLVALQAGCLGRSDVDRDLMARKQPAASSPGIAQAYIVHFPDVLDVRLEGHPEWSGQFPVRIDGRIEAGPSGGVRAEGHSVQEVALALAEQAGVAAEAVRVAV